MVGDEVGAGSDGVMGKSHRCLGGQAEVLEFISVMGSHGRETMYNPHLVTAKGYATFSLLLFLFY